jgi:hypothetical protein
MGTGLGLGIGIPFRRVGAGIDAQAQAHYNRVIADGGLIPSGLAGVNNFFTTVKGIYGTSDITTAISVGLDAQVLGYKLGAGAGTTAGQAAQKLYSCSGSSGDVVQTTAASQPLLLVHSGVNYWFGSGVDGNYTQSNLQSTFNFGSDFSIVFEIEPRASTTGELSGCLNGLFYTFALISSGIIRFNGGGQTINSTTPITFTRQWIRVSRSGSTWSFFTSLDRITWTSLGTATNSVSLTGGSINIEVGRGSGGVGVAFAGKIHRALFYMDATVTTLVRDFNPATYNAATSQTQWTSSTGEVWTINTGTAATGYKGVLVDRTEVQGDGIDDKLTASGLSAITLNTRISALNPINLSGGYIIQGRQSGTGDKHLWYQTGGNIQAYTNAGGSINFGGISANSLKVLSTDFNTTSSNCLTNNANQVNGTLNSDAFTDLDVFGGTASFKNCIINTLIETSSVSTSTQKTAMYNYIRSINNL